MTTAAELFASLAPGDSVDLGGETIDASPVPAVPANVTVANATFVGEMELYAAEGLALVGCEFLPSLRLLGGHGWRVSGATFRGGVVMAQLNIGLDWNTRPREGCPTDWLVEDCTFHPLDGQAGSYPQGHQLYALTTPRFDMRGRIERCTFTDGRFGAALKLGGTGNYWRSEGVRGVTVTECDITGDVLTQGARTDVALHRCILRGANGAPAGVSAMDGSRCHLTDTKAPDGLAFYATWYPWIFGLIRRETREAVAGRTKRGGIVWS